jgi:dephospho-CoA kinase
MLLIGLTGSIGMGKSETARMFAALGIPVYDSDAAVHALYEFGGAAVAPIESAFPGVAADGRVDRAKLSAKVVHDTEALKRLESIVHPLVAGTQRAFLQKAANDGAKMVVLDIPLLYETEGHKRVDVTVVVSAPGDVQRQRVLARPGMTPEKLDAILAKQLTDVEKRARADFVVDTSKGLEHARDQVAEIVKALEGRESKIWPKDKREH